MEAEVAVVVKMVADAEIAMLARETEMSNRAETSQLVNEFDSSL